MSYEWKSEEYPQKGFTQGKQIGFIALEVEQVIPELVTTDDDGYKGVSYGNMTAILVEAVKELKAQNEKLEAQNDGLVESVNELKAQNDALKAIVCMDHPEQVICQ